MPPLSIWSADKNWEQRFQKPHLQTRRVDHPIHLLTWRPGHPPLTGHSEFRTVDVTAFLSSVSRSVNGEQGKIKTGASARTGFAAS
jgi:hypothetical protein